MHIAAPGMSLMVDASMFGVSAAEEMVSQDYVPPPGMLVQLAAAGVRPEDVRHVVITHAHWDHFNGTTLERDGHLEPAFANARYYLGRADWEHPEMQAALADAYSLEPTFRTSQSAHFGISLCPTNPGHFWPADDSLASESTKRDCYI